jgi:hypothetical protein
LVQGFQVVLKILEFGEGQGVVALFFALDDLAVAEDGGEFEIE